MFSLPAAKLGVQFVAGLGVSKILADIVKNNVTIVTTAEKVMVNTGSFVLGSMLIEQSSAHIDRVAQEVSTWFESRKDDTKDNTKK